MWQAEIGNAKVTAANSLPGPGNLMCDFTLRSTRGTPVSPYDYRGRSSLVLFFAGPATHAVQKILCSSLVARYLEIRDRGAEVLVILPGSAQACLDRNLVELPFPVLLDEDMQVHQAVGAGDTQNAPVPAVYVTDPISRSTARGVPRKRTPSLRLGS
jgi:peroxiredoxin